MEPLAAERLLPRLVVPPVAERIVRVGARAQADLATLPRRDGLLVLVEDLHVPARHRLSHRPLAHLHEGVVGHEWIRLGEPVVVEHGDAVLLAEPPDRLGVQRFACRADPAERLRIERPRIIDRHHRAHRRRRREDVRHLVTAEERKLLVRARSLPRADRRIARRRVATVRATAQSRLPRPTPPSRGTARRPAPRGSERNSSWPRM